MFIRFGATHERDGQTDGQTPRDGNTGITQYRHYKIPLSRAANMKLHSAYSSITASNNYTSNAKILI